MVGIHSANKPNYTNICTNTLSNHIKCAPLYPYNISAFRTQPAVFAYIDSIPAWVLWNEISKTFYLKVPPFASASRPSSGSIEHFPLPVANLIPSFAKFPTWNITFEPHKFVGAVSARLCCHKRYGNLISDDKTFMGFGFRTLPPSSLLFLFDSP